MNTGPRITAEAIWDNLDLSASRADRLILYEIARRKVAGLPQDPNMSMSDNDVDDDDNDNDNEEYGEVEQYTSAINSNEVANDSDTPTAPLL